MLCAFCNIGDADRWASGIGLSLVRAIADTLHGACGAENVKGGICFWFELPDLLPAEDSEIKD